MQPQLTPADLPHCSDIFLVFGSDSKRMTELVFSPLPEKLHLSAVYMALGCIVCQSYKLSHKLHLPHTAVSHIAVSHKLHLPCNAD